MDEKLFQEIRKNPIELGMNISIEKLKKVLKEYLF